MSCVTLGGPSRKVKFYRSGDGQCGKELNWHTEWITAAAYAPDGVLFATGDRNGGVAGLGSRIHEPNSTSLRGHEKAITATAWRPDGNVLATAREDGGIRFWDMNDGSTTEVLDRPSGRHARCRMVADGMLATGGRDKK